MAKISLVRPAQPIVSAAKGARDRLLVTLSPMKGEDAVKLRRAVNTMFNAIVRFQDGDFELRQPMPHGVQRNPTTAIERSVMAYWKALDLLQDRIFRIPHSVTEAIVINTFNAIV
jgi:hypothetical protein